MNCGYHCHEAGGTWIAENPNCPVHGTGAHAEEYQRESVKDTISDDIKNAETIDDLRMVLYSILELL